MAASSYNSIAEAIYETLAGKSPEEQRQAMPLIVEFLARRRLMSKSEEILRRLEKIIDKKEGRVRAIVSGKLPLQAEVKDTIRENLKKRYGAGDVVIEEKADNTLIGGFRIEVGDDVIDLTARNKIEKLQEHLTRAYA